MAAARGANAAMTTVTYGSTRVSRPAVLLLASASAGSGRPVDGPAPRGFLLLAACPVSLRDRPAPAGTAGTRPSRRVAGVSAGTAAAGAARCARRADSQHKAARIAKMAR